MGLSREPYKDSHIVAKYLQEKEYKIIPVHPTAQEILGDKVFHSLSEIKQPVDIIDIFRPSKEFNNEKNNYSCNLAPNWMHWCVEGQPHDCTSAGQQTTVAISY